MSLPGRPSNLTPEGMEWIRQVYHARRAAPKIPSNNQLRAGLNISASTLDRAFAAIRAETRLAEALGARERREARRVAAQP